MNKSVVIIDQAAGQKQLAILEAYAGKYDQRAIIAGTVTERNSTLPKDVIWEKAIRYNRSNLFQRIFTWTVFTIQTLYYVLTKYRKADLLIITNPPLSVFITLFTSNTYDLLIFDLFPDALHEYNYLSKKSFIFKIWAQQNKKIFNRARRIFTLSEGMRKMLNKYVESDKVEVVSLWTDTSYLKPLSKSENWFAQELGISSKFTILYSGNLGLTHPVEVMFELAMSLKDDPDIFFLIIGGGHKYEQLKNMISQSELQNIRIMEWQPPKNVPYSMNSADVGLVTLDEKASHLSVPSKVFDSFSIGVPVIAIAADDSELAGLLNKYKAGKSFGRDDLEEIKDFILQLRNDKAFYEEICDNSLKASLFHTPSNAKEFV